MKAMPSESFNDSAVLSQEKERLRIELMELKRQLAGSPTEEKYNRLKSNLIQQKNYSDEMYARNQRLDVEIARLRAILTEGKDAESSEMRLEQELAKVRAELGQRNVELASIKVDVEKGEFEFKKRCEVLQSDLDYEKANNTRLTQEIRRHQSSAAALDSTMVVPSSVKQPLKQKQQEQLQGSPVWSSGSGALKEIQLHNAEMRVKTLEKENKTLKEHEEFYLNKGREWKNRALKYEKTLEKNNIPVPGKEVKKEEASDGDKDHQQVDSVEESKENEATTQNNSAAYANSSATSNLDLMLNSRQAQPSRDFRKTEKTKNECQTQ